MINIFQSDVVFSFLRLVIYIYFIPYKKYISFGRNILQNLSEIYTKATIITKQRIIGLTFPEKLKFIENECRTFGMAKVLSLICPALKELHGQKKGAQDEICLEPRWVDLLGLEPRLF